jgi:phage major head subunit gpT-like protein
LGQFPSLREWIGPRVIKNLMAHGFSIKNRLFESTIAVDRVSIEDDRYSVLGPVLSEMGMAAGDHPNELVMSLLGAGFTTQCYDGQYFFDTDHPVGDQEAAAVSVSNFQGGAGTPWYLLDTSRAIKPLIYQERIPYKLISRTNEEDDNVFNNDEYVYGVRARSNAGYGLWQLAYASKQDLTAANYEAARAAMMALKGESGRPLNIKPTVLVVPPSLEGAAMRLLNNGTRVEESGGTPVAIANEWAGTPSGKAPRWGRAPITPAAWSATSQASADMFRPPSSRRRRAPIAGSARTRCRSSPGAARACLPRGRWTTRTRSSGVRSPVEGAPAMCRFKWSLTTSEAAMRRRSK